ncbi:MAG: SMP-30/gluconolactonase/LRE family protein [Alphaproteobacteria bacterium]|nr:SMP-30/gluconolactonase/LRE family protein [Alphaproteobacteria bacterium]
MVEPRCIWPLNMTLGEGPVWDPARKALFFVDIKKGHLHRYDPKGETRTSHELAEPVCAMGLAAGGRFIAALKTRVAFIDATGRPVEAVGTPSEEPATNRFNDGKVDRAGRFWFGSMDDAEKGTTGALYSLSKDRQFARHDDGYAVTNGPDFSPDGRTLYHTDTFAGVIYAFDVRGDGSLANKRPFIAIPREKGFPDGMCVDAEGYIWQTLFFGGRVLRFDPKGREVGEIRLPVSNVTSCCFGGEDFSDLYITTARWFLDETKTGPQPLAGGLFVCRPGVRGVAANMFAG